MYYQLMKKFIKENIYLLLIIMLGTILRFVFLDKPNGLGYDELIGTLKEANQPNILAVISYTLKMDIHFPLYQVMLHLWAKIFSFADYSLRSFSAFFGMLTVLVAYFIGKKLKSKDTGLVCSLIFAINSFLIYYSQEARMYGFMSLLSSLFLLFTVKIKNNPQNNWNYFGFILFAFAVITSYTISAVFVFAQIGALIIYLISEKKTSKKLLVSAGILIALCLPFLIFILANSSKYTNFFGGFYFDASSIFAIAQNWFTPVLQHNNPAHYMGILFNTFNFLTFVFILVPLILATCAICYSVKKDKFSSVLLGAAIVFLISELIAMKFTHFKLIARYTMVIAPNLLVLIGYGFSLIGNKKYLKTILLSIFILTNMFYLTFSPNSAFRQHKDGFKQLANILNANNINNNDFVIVWNNREVLDRYVDKKLNVLGLLANVAYTSEVILQNQDKLNELSLEQRKAVLRNYFASDYVPVNNIYLIDMIYNHMKSGQKLFITTNDYFDSFTQNSLAKIASSDKDYKAISYNDLLTAKALINTKQLCNKKFRFLKRIEENHFVVIIFQK